MWYSTAMKSQQEQNNYSLVDSGEGRKLERFGPYLIDRPCAQAVWKKQLSDRDWLECDAVFTREGENRWIFRHQLPEMWHIDVSSIAFKISPTDFGHLGIFPEQDLFWRWIQERTQAEREKRRRPLNVLNLFAYSGGSTLAAAKGGAQVCHLDASKGMVAWARENAALNQLTEAPIRWIVDDAAKFLTRELKRGVRYDAIILDPPTFGRGAKGELFKIESDLMQLLEQCRSLLTDTPSFLLFSCHTPGFTPLVMHHTLLQMMDGLKGTIDVGEMVLKGEKGVLPIPSGVFARWVNES